MIRRIVLVAAVAALGFSLVPANATSHCDNPINFLSGSGLLINPRSVGCDGVAEDLQETPGDDSNTDYIIPGATQGIVRWLESGTEPVDGVRLGDGTVVGSRIEFNGVTTALRFTPGTGIDGSPAGFDSQAITIGRQASLTGGDALITVCRDAEAADCVQVTYRTLASA